MKSNNFLNYEWVSVKLAFFIIDDTLTKKLMKLSKIQKMVKSRHLKSEFKRAIKKFVGKYIKTNISNVYIVY